MRVSMWLSALGLAACGGAPSWWLQEPSGPLVDAQCNLETVETANQAQLHALLTELSESTFFRLIRVNNMDGRCMYWGKSEPKEDDDADDEPACEAKAEETATPLCTVGADDSPFGGGGGVSAFGSAPRSSAPPSSSSSSGGGALDATITPAEDAVIAAVRARPPARLHARAHARTHARTRGSTWGRDAHARRHTRDAARTTRPAGERRRRGRLHGRSAAHLLARHV